MCKTACAVNARVVFSFFLRGGVMARGKKTDTETVYKIMVSYFNTDNFNETAKILNIPARTVEKIVKDNKNKPEFAKLCVEKKQDFAKKASEIIDKGLILLNRRLDTAIKHEESLDMIIDEIYAADKKDIKQEEKQRLVSQIRLLQVQKMGDITTSIGTLYDKRALALGESTENVTFTIPDGVKKYAE